MSEHDALMPRVTIPAPTIALLGELDGEVACAVTDKRITFTARDRSIASRLIDGTFPDYARIIPAASGNRVSIASAPLAAAVARLKAVADKDSRQHGIGLTWGNNDGFRVCLARDPESYEELEAEIVGTGRVAMNPVYLLDQLKAFDGERVVLDAADGANPVLVTRPDEPDTVSLIMALAWRARGCEDQGAQTNKTDTNAAPSEDARRGG
jgi:DNA polymerase-3 subunit beta